MAKNIIGILRKFRHGPLKKIQPIWSTLGGLFRWSYTKIGSPGTVLQTVGGYGPFKFDGHFAFSNFEEWGGRHNAGFRESIEASRGKQCVLDIGAHIGLVSMPMSSVISDDGDVYSFEPAEVNRKYLLKHVLINNIKNIHVQDFLVGDVDGINVEFFEQKNDTVQNSVVIKKNHDAYTKTHKIQRTIDDFCAENHLIPDVIKIDVEGYELSVLRGAKKIISSSKPIIFLSVHPREIELLGEDINNITKMVDELGYGMSEADGSAVTSLKLSEYILKSNVENNYGE